MLDCRPSEDLIASVLSEELRDALEYLHDGSSSCFEAALECFEPDKKAFACEANESRDMLLFVPDKRFVPQSSSFYLSIDRAAYSEHTLWVRGYFKKYGFDKTEALKIPDDSISCELDFLSKMCVKVKEAAEADRIEESVFYAAGVEEFIDSHASKWMPLFFERIEENAGSAYWAAVSEIALVALRHYRGGQCGKQW